MATKKVTITLPEETLASVDRLAGHGARSAFIEAAVADRLDRAERAQRAVDWLAAQAEAADPKAWGAALEQVAQADARRGYTPNGDGQDQAA
jgi:predicted transcriptional regulator